MSEEIDNRCEHQKHDWRHGMKQMCLECYEEEHAELSLLRLKIESLELQASALPKAHAQIVEYRGKLRRTVEALEDVIKKRSNKYTYDRDKIFNIATNALSDISGEEKS